MLWSEDLPVVQFRIARPTTDLARIMNFYRDGIGLPVIYCYEMDADYDGVMFGLPNRHYHLEITRHSGDKAFPVPPADNLLVFYLPGKNAIEKIIKRLEGMGHRPVPPCNPYWAEHGVTFADPDGWRIVLMNTAGFGTDIAPS
jgi:catechol 2,3-dioxygenase-like lactoylglutathione lyase family enzyme